MPVNTALQEGGLPSVNPGFTTFGTHGNDPAHEGENKYQVMDNVTKIAWQPLAEDGLRGHAHALVQHLRCATAGSVHLQRPVYRSVGIEATLEMPARTSSPWAHCPAADIPPRTTWPATNISTFTYQHFVQQYMGAYIQDDWKVTPKLTLNLGLRYEYFTPKREQSNQLGNFVWLTGR